MQSSTLSNSQVSTPIEIVPETFDDFLQEEAAAPQPPAQSPARSPAQPAVQRPADQFPGNFGKQQENADGGEKVENLDDDDSPPPPRIQPQDVNRSPDGIKTIDRMAIRVESIVYQPPPVQEPGRSLEEIKSTSTVSRLVSGRSSTGSDPPCPLDSDPPEVWRLYMVRMRDILAREVRRERLLNLTSRELDEKIERLKAKLKNYENDLNYDERAKQVLKMTSRVSEYYKSKLSEIARLYRSTQAAT